MKKKIEHPKVFISYAWGTDEHDENVILFATDLKNDGVEVVFDKWQLKEGFDTYAFMEKSATDPSITNVLILLDPIYAKKADSRSGGVGTETQIISPEVYNKVEQDKFIPIVFERDGDGNICKPKYLGGLLHFDLTHDEKYDLEYQRLVRRLYGIDTLKEPELGNPPAWLEEPPKISYKSKVSKEYFKGSSPDILKKKKFNESISEVIEQIFNYSYKNNYDLAKKYTELVPFRDEFLLLLKISDYITDGYKNIISMLEVLASRIRNDYSIDISLKKTLVHELFIYIISFYFKQKDKEALRYILTKTYFIGSSNFNEYDDSYNSFYYNNEQLDQAVCEKDNKKYYCGTASLWMELINVEICNKNEFVFADLFCYNCSYLIENYESGWAWFPITYVYSGEYQHNYFRNYSLKLKSREHLMFVMYITGYSEIETFTRKYEEIEGRFKQGEYQKYRYNGCLNIANTFWDFINFTEIGMRN